MNVYILANNSSVINRGLTPRAFQEALNRPVQEAVTPPALGNQPPKVYYSSGADVITSVAVVVAPIVMMAFLAFLKRYQSPPHS